uniref:Dihydrolipoyllysine-residue succinyltransferase component of 2-oxoglutarate dehydrogenase complex, mitochondrial n=1 Tax=Onchocerca volvulus TaxID=6282 RepID=A0A8R1XXR4_ONCVO
MARSRPEHTEYRVKCNKYMGGMTVLLMVDSADQKSFAEIELALAAFGKRAGEGKLQVSEMEGATFTISSGGIYGSIFSSPIINPPHSGVLGMHSIQNRPVAVGNSIEIRSRRLHALSPFYDLLLRRT